MSGEHRHLTAEFGGLIGYVTGCPACEAARPSRTSLCPEAGLRAAMSDGEFWEHVYGGARHGESDEPDPSHEAIDADLTAPCPECGEFGACGYDAEGRPLIHAINKDDGA